MKYMIESVIGAIGTASAYLLILFFLYSVVWYRGIRFYYKLWYYHSQGIPYVKGIYPLVGSAPKLAELAKETS